MKVLALGDQVQAMARFGAAARGGEIDATPNGGLYDVVFLGHSLQRVPRGAVAAEITDKAQYLRTGGELWVTVPSLEWAGKMVATKEEPDFAVYYSLYGLDNEPHSCGFTLYWLRIAVEAAGLFVTQAHAEPYILGINNQPLRAFQNVVVALKCSDTTASVDSLPKL